MKKFMTKLIPALLLIPVLVTYQNCAQARASVLAYHQKEEEAAAALAAEYAAMQEEAAKSPYDDGTYLGVGAGFGGDIQVELVIQDGKMTELDLLSAQGEDKAYLDEALVILDQVLAKQNLEVDTVSGATCSSEGILDAVSQALEEAIREE